MTPRSSWIRGWRPLHHAAERRPAADRGEPDHHRPEMKEIGAPRRPARRHWSMARYFDNRVHGGEGDHRQQHERDAARAMHPRRGERRRGRRLVGGQASGPRSHRRPADPSWPGSTQHASASSSKSFPKILNIIDIFFALHGVPVRRGEMDPSLRQGNKEGSEGKILSGRLGEQFRGRSACGGSPTCRRRSRRAWRRAAAGRSDSR